MKGGRDQLPSWRPSFVKQFARDLLRRRIAPHISTKSTGRDKALMRVRMRKRGFGYWLSERARKKIEELWGEGKELHGLRRFLRRGLANVRQEALLIGWLLNLKRIAALKARAPA